MKQMKDLNTGIMAWGLGRTIRILVLTILLVPLALAAVVLSSGFVRLCVCRAPPSPEDQVSFLRQGSGIGISLLSMLRKQDRVTTCVSCLLQDMAVIVGTAMISHSQGL